MKIAADIKLKHGKLWLLCQEVGGTNALAESIGIGKQTVHAWLFLRKCPTPGVYTQWYTKDVEQRLEAIAECSAEELFPAEYRDAVKVLKGNTHQVTIADVSPGQLTALAETFVTRNTLPSPVDVAEREDQKRLIKRAMRRAKLSFREREVIRMRYGLDGGVALTLDETGEAFRVSKERVRQIEQKALRKMRDVDTLDELIPERLPDMTTIDAEWKRKSGLSLSEIMKERQS